MDINCLTLPCVERFVRRPSGSGTREAAALGSTQVSSGADARSFSALRFGDSDSAQSRGVGFSFFIISRCSYLQVAAATSNTALGTVHNQRTRECPLGSITKLPACVARWQQQHPVIYRRINSIKRTQNDFVHHGSGAQAYGAISSSERSNWEIHKQTTKNR